MEMSQIGLFVKEARKWLAFEEPIVIVVGNESCDLDSAVSAIALAYLYMVTSAHLKSFSSDGKRRFMPVLNILRENLPLKTEVVHHMRKHGIDIDDLICRDEISPKLLSMSKFILVDHHIPTAMVGNGQIISVFDHRPLDANNFLVSNDGKVKLDEVGSCATLIADEIRDLNHSFEDHRELIKFLWGPIVLDTHRLSESAGKAKPLDIEINIEIENTLGLTETDRLNLFHELKNVRNNVSSVSTLQLLSKDLKFTSNKNKSYVVAVPTFPILVEEYIQKEDALESLQKFGADHNCDLLVLIGKKSFDSGSRRDIGLFPQRQSDFTQQIINAVSITNHDFLQLDRKCTDILDPEIGQVYEQKNLKASRKQILPIIQKVLDS